MPPYRAAGSLPIGVHYGAPRVPTGPVSLGNHTIIAHVPVGSIAFVSAWIALGAGDGTTFDGRLSISVGTNNGPPSITALQIDGVLFAAPFGSVLEQLFGNPAPNQPFARPFAANVVMPVEWLSPVPAAYSYEAQVTGAQVFPNCPLGAWRPLRHSGPIRNSVGFVTDGVTIAAPGPIVGTLRIRDPVTLGVLAIGAFTLSLSEGP